MLVFFPQVYKQQNLTHKKCTPQLSHVEICVQTVWAIFRIPQANSSFKRTCAETRNRKVKKDKLPLLANAQENIPDRDKMLKKRNNERTNDCKPEKPCT